MDGRQLKTKKEVSNCPTRLDEYRYCSCYICYFLNSVRLESLDMSCIDKCNFGKSLQDLKKCFVHQDNHWTKKSCVNNFLNFIDFCDGSSGNDRNFGSFLKNYLHQRNLNFFINTRNSLH